MPRHGKPDRKLTFGITAFRMFRSGRLAGSLSAHQLEAAVVAAAIV
jgi:hypothetical protein